MRKFIVLFSVILFTLAFSSVAFAHYPASMDFDTGHGSWASDGYQGYYRAGDDFDEVGFEEEIDSRDGDWYRFYDEEGNVQYFYLDETDSEDGEWYYYYDENGDRRYIYDDDDEDGDWKYNSYTDEYGNTQYSRTKVTRLS